MANLTKHQLEIIAAAVLKEHQKAVAKSDKPQKDWRLRNTKLLLKKYRWLQFHCEGIIEDLEDYEDEIFDHEELNLKTLMKYKARTKKMMDYFDATWGSYFAYSKQNSPMSERRSKILWHLYLSPDQKTRGELSELYGVDESTIRRDETKATQELSIFLFGIDSLADLEKIIVI